MTALEINLMEDIDECNEKICKVLYEVTDKVIGKKGSCKKRKAVPWWTGKCSDAVKNRNKAFRKIKKI